MPRWFGVAQSAARETSTRQQQGDLRLRSPPPVEPHSSRDAEQDDDGWLQACSAAPKRDSSAADDTDSEGDWEDDLSADMDGNEDITHENMPHVKGKGRRLWSTNELFPSGGKKWRDTANCTAVMTYDCPCGRRCLGRVPSAIDIYEHRRQLRAQVASQGSGGLRDILRKEMARHYDRNLNAFSHSFVVGSAGSICERAYAVASGASEATYARARADVTKDRPLHNGRATAKAAKESEARRLLGSWVCAQRNSMEGDKQSGLKWYTEKTTERQLWARYITTCDKAQQPSVGSSQLLWKIWKEHREIVEVPPTGHDKCDACAAFKSARLAIAGLDEPAKVAEIEAEEAAHTVFHTTEREYYNRAVEAATYHPEKVTTITIDAPTRHQFDLPSQARAKRDTAKKLDGKNRWESKLEGVLDAGPYGMLVFLAAAAIGGGANLVCTVLMLSLHEHIRSGRALGMKLHLQLDNTSAENKNRTVISFVALLVQWGVFHEASIFFMPVGHTFNELDAAFSPLITAMLRTVVPTISALMDFVESWLSRKNIRIVRNLPHIWDFTSYLEPHTHGIAGFCTTQQSSGFHEFHFSKGSQGEVRMRYRQSSQSSTWYPEGEGDPIFKTVPDPNSIPPIAPFKSDLGWRRTDVQVNIRRWLQCLGLRVEKRAEAEREWESVFASMPQDGDVSRLTSEQKLQWHPLPTARPLPVPQPAGIHAMRDMVENPPVNPVTGMHRRASVVRAELQEHNEALRLTNPEPMMFLGDYLFFLPKDSNEVRLGRIQSAPYGGASLPTDEVAVVEYSQTNVTGNAVSRFFGSFAPRKNEAYDKTVKGSLAFIRHHDIGRGRILVYNVQTFCLGKDLYVDLESLRSLARVRPGDCAIPQHIPSTHTHQHNVQLAARPRAPRANTAVSPPVANGTRIEIFWTEDPAGWFAGIVTSSRRDNDTWVTRVLYDASDRWRQHAAWHHLDNDDDDHVLWRLAVGAAAQAGEPAPAPAPARQTRAQQNMRKRRCARVVSSDSEVDVPEEEDEDEEDHNPSPSSSPSADSSDEDICKLRNLLLPRKKKTRKRARR